MPEEQTAWSSPRAVGKHENEIKHRKGTNILNCEPSFSGKLDADIQMQIFASLPDILNVNVYNRQEDDVPDRSPRDFMSNTF